MDRECQAPTLWISIALLAGYVTVLSNAIEGIDPGGLKQEVSKLIADSIDGVAKASEVKSISRNLVILKVFLELVFDL
jgi:hypothetical protein